jgi:hypothetical protein
MIRDFSLRDHVHKLLSLDTDPLDDRVAIIYRVKTTASNH